MKCYKCGSTRKLSKKNQRYMICKGCRSAEYSLYKERMEAKKLPNVDEFIFMKPAELDEEAWRLVAEAKLAKLSRRANQQ